MQMVMLIKYIDEVLSENVDHALQLSMLSGSARPAATYKIILRPVSGSQI